MTVSRIFVRPRSSYSESGELFKHERHNITYLLSKLTEAMVTPLRHIFSETFEDSENQVLVEIEVAAFSDAQTELVRHVLRYRMLTAPRG